MKASATIFYNQIFNFFRARCITKELPVKSRLLLWQPDESVGFKWNGY